MENQPIALIEVYEGESAAARENAVVASITLPLVPAPFGSPNILVRVRIAVSCCKPEPTGRLTESTLFGDETWMRLWT